MFMVNRRLSAKEERLYQAFKRLDVDDDGKITVLELQAGTPSNMAQ
jgi:Ca2+-binding EF-hand superfamily protein